MNGIYPNSIQCACCESTDTTSMGVVLDRDGRLTGMWVCKNCNAFTPDYKSDLIENLTEHQAMYHAKYWKGCTRDDLEQVVSDLRGMVKYYADFLGPPGTDSTVLEIGAGRGCLIEALRREGYNPEGCEPSAQLADRAWSTFEIPKNVLRHESADAFLMRLHDRHQLYSTVFAWHVIEHVKYPLRLLRALGRILTRDGTILLQAPLAMQEHIFMEHLYLFSPALPFKMAELCDLKVVDYWISEREGFITFALARLRAARAPVHPHTFAALRMSL